LPDDNTERLLKGSRYYSETLGWKILPCHGITNGKCTCGQKHGEPKEVGKHPVINQWNSESTSDPDVTRKWWSKNPEYNIGVHCSKSGFFVIDIDPRSGGPESFQKFAEEVGEENLPKTIEAITGTYTGDDGQPKRGRHIFYRCDPSESLIGHLGALNLKGVDIKHNGYVLISPSRHFSGVTYEWAEGKAPWEIEMADAPEGLLDVLRKKTRRSSYSLGSGEWDWLSDVTSNNGVDYSKVLKEGLEEGNRAVGIYELSCHLANKYGTDPMSANFIETYLIRFNAELITPPMELEGTNGLLQHVRRAIKFIDENPKQTLPPHIQEWLQESAPKTKTGNPGNTPLALTGVVRPPSSDTELSTLTDEEFTDEGETGWLVGETVRTAIEGGDSIAEAVSSKNISLPHDVDSIDENEGGIEGSRSLSDMGNGRRLVDIFGPGARYTSGLGWFVWKNGYWKPDVEDLEITEYAKKIPTFIASETKNIIAGKKELSDQDNRNQALILKWSEASRANARIRGTVEAAKSDPRIAVDVEQWDQDDNLMGVLNGVIDLKTGDLLKGRPDLHITRRAPVSYTRGHRNQRWESFLDFATRGDKELQEWLQKAAGYSLTGSNKYDIMFLVYGPPGSGKNTFVEALVKCLGTKQYAWPLDSTILAQDGGSNGNSDLYHWAQLRGRRMVWVDELPESERIKENAVKKLTGSSEISARSPGEQPFTFESKAKLWISTNNRPIITDDAMWRRMRPVPFTAVPEVPDPGLKEYIFDPEGALPAVLSWAVEGAIKILNSPEPDPLGWCSVVREAAEKYRKNEDRIGLFMTEQTEEVEGERVQIKRLYENYRSWAMNRGESPMSQIRFHRKLSERGLKIDGDGTNATLLGYQRKAVPPPSSDSLDYSELSQRAVPNF